MQEKMMDRMNDMELTPADFITLMFKSTDEDGILYIPGWHYSRPGWQSNAPGSTDENKIYRCKMDWDLAKYEKVQEKFEHFYCALKEIAKHYDDLFEEEKDPDAILASSELSEIWNLYLKPLDIGTFDQDKFDEIYNKLDNITWVEEIKQKIADGQELQDFEEEILTDYKDLSVTEEELEYRRQFLNHLSKQAELRLGDHICAYDIVLRAWRVSKLFALGAPKVIIHNEGRQLAAAFVLHEYGISREIMEATNQLS